MSVNALDLAPVSGVTGDGTVTDLSNDISHVLRVGAATYAVCMGYVTIPCVDNGVEPSSYPGSDIAEP